LGPTLEVSVVCDQPGAEIRYTLDGTAPGAGQGELYTGPFTLKKSAKVQVWAALPGGGAGTAQAFYTVNQIVASPDGTGDGSWDAPIGGLSNAVAKALQTGASEVCLMAGNYTESVALTRSLTLSGGWVAWQNQTGVTSITAPERGGTTLKDPSSVVKASGEGTTLVLQNLTLTGSDDSFGAAVATQAGASIIVKKCHLSGGGGSYSYGLRTFHSPLVRIEDSEISGGNGGSTFAVSTDTSTLDLRRSTLDGGTGTAVSYALSMTGSKGVVVSSVLWGASANSSYGVALYSSHKVDLIGDTIDGGTGTTAWGVFIAETEPRIIDCLIGAQGSGQSYGVYENYGHSVPTKIENCVFFGANSGLYYDNATKTFWKAFNAQGSFISPDGSQLMRHSQGNRSANVSLGPAPELMSPNLVLLRCGVKINGPAERDRQGQLRSSPWTVGAYEITP
jgi:hypothetical protein